MQSFGYPRFYGGHYDSTKQKDVRDHILGENIQIWREELKRRYTARMRLDILLAGNTVITDAQFYDGLFFHALVETTKSREDFFDFLKRARGEMDAPLIEVRRRAGGLDQILAKPFIFSSLITREAKDTVKGAMTDVLAANQPSESKFGGWKDVVAAVDARVDKPAVKLALAEVSESLSYLAETPERVFVEWDPPRVKGFAELLRLAKEQRQFFVPTTGNAEINESLQKIGQEMNQPSPNRGNIEQWIAACKSSDPSDKNRQKMLDDLWAAVCQVYNTAIADQHCCTSLDFGEIDLVGSDAGDLVEFLSSELISAIAEESWDEYLGHLTTDKKLNGTWTAFRYGISNPRPEPAYKEEIRRLLGALIKAMQSSYGQSCSQVVKDIVGGGSSPLSCSAEGFSFRIPGLDALYRVAIAPLKIRKIVKDRSTLVRYGMNVHKL